VTLSTFSVHLRVNLLASSRFLTVFPRSVLRVNEGLYPVKILPVALPEPATPWPVVVVTLKNRTLSPVVGVFVEMLRAHINSKDGFKLGKKPR
jgi:DNA-binding transcriptional LysR family regulator